MDHIKILVMRVPLQRVSNELLLEPLYIAITVNIFLGKTAISINSINIAYVEHSHPDL